MGNEGVHVGDSTESFSRGHLRLEFEAANV
jgi:hypothetical protein